MLQYGMCIWCSECSKRLAVVVAGATDYRLPATDEADLVVEGLEVELGLSDGVVRADEVVVPHLHEEARRLLGQEDGPGHAPVEFGVAG